LKSQAIIFYFCSSQLGKSIFCADFQLYVKKIQNKIDDIEKFQVLIQNSLSFPGFSG